jgi:hypothetical protein
MAVSTVFASRNGQAQGTPPSVRPPMPALHLSKHMSGEEAVSALGTNLPAVAAHYFKGAEELKQTLRHDKDLKVDREGRLLYVCQWLGGAKAPTAPAEPVTSAIAALDQTFLLHSRPGSNRKIFLDFDGHIISGTQWNTDNNGGADIVAPPWDTDGDPTTFGTAERTAIQQIWLRVAEDYAPYDVDVTTEYPGEAALTRGTTSDAVYGVRALVSPIGSYFGNPGGISYVGVFDNVGDHYKPSLIFPENLSNSEKNIAEAISHEVGHSLGLSHDGTSTADYYSGQGNWAPIMGVGYYKPLSQWSKGEYSSANNTEDDLTVITQNGLSYRLDDFGNSIATAQALLGTAPKTNGVIERNTDVDYFSFQAGAGTAVITVNPSERGQNLHLVVGVYDGVGNVVTNREVADTTAGAQPVTISLPTARGTYFVSVRGGGSGSVLSTGYSAYGSLGQYTIALSISQALVSLQAPVIASSAKVGTNISLQFQSQSSVNYVLQTSTNLTSWQSLSTNAGSGSTLNLLTPLGTGTAKRFWRLMAY